MVDSVNGSIDNARPGAPNTTNTNTQTRTKRSRVQFSCTACRFRKLKCDRTYPCDRCTRRGDAASCIFVGHGPRTRANNVAASNPSHIQDRIQHLENLILSFAQKKKQEDESTSDDATTTTTTTTAAGSASADNRPVNIENNHDEYNVAMETEQNTVLEDNPGKIMNIDKLGTTYVDASHWQAILDDLKQFKEYVQLDGDDERGMDDDDLLNGDSPDELDSLEQDANRPTLLFHGGHVPTRQELLADLPNRQTMDRLIGRLLNSGDPTSALIHFPTFLREYTEFCDDPTRASLPWLGFLYGCMALTVGIFRRSLEQLPAPLGDAADEITRFERNCCYCLINSNYMTVGKYKVEALVVYCTIEYTKRYNSALSVSVILGITIKLAMQMGYHRDAKHYNTISTLEGEMRRRTWAIICQLDTLTAFQAGIPKQTQPWQSDTEPPRNILDEDFDENSIELPPARPDSVRTPASYLVSKLRVMSAFGQISDLAYSRHPITYEKVLEIDRNLEEAHELIASPLRMRPLNQCIIDDSSLIMKRYTLDVLYQKARIVLHRKYLVEARYNPLLTYSRTVCVNAAKEILRHQYELFQESQMGGRLDKDNWFFRSLQHHDFVLAAMVICLELFKYNDTISPTDLEQQQQHQTQATAPSERDNLIELLRNSQEIWKRSLKHSVEARKAYSALTIMLKKAEIDQEARRKNSESTVPAQNGQILPRMTNFLSQNGPLDMQRINTSPGDITTGESASSTGQDPYLNEFTPQNMDANIPTPSTSNSSAQTSNSATGCTIDEQQQQQSTIQPDVLHQEFPDFQFPLSQMDVIQNMLDTPQDLDWHLWDGQIQAMDPGFMNEPWSPEATGANAMQMNGESDGTATVVMGGSNQVDGIFRNGYSNGDGNGNGNNSTQSNSLVDLYWQPGYRG